MDQSSSKLPLSALALVVVLVAVFGYVAIRQFGRSPAPPAPASKAASAAAAEAPDDFVPAGEPAEVPADGDDPGWDLPEPGAVPSAPMPARAASDPATAPSSFARPLAAAREGNYPQAARLWAESLEGRPGAFTIQLSANCETANLKALFENPQSDENLFLLPLVLEGRSCYRVCYGLYPDRASAEGTVRSVQNGLSRQVARVAPLTDLLQR